MKISLVYTTYPDEATASDISNALLKGKHIACFNIIPISSGFWWEGQLNMDNEVVSIFKTTAEKLAGLEFEYSSKHPYQVPCFMHWEVTVNAAYGEWLKHSLI